MENVFRPNLLEELQKLGSLIRDIDYAVVTTINEKGKMHSRPMISHQENDFNGDLWFFSSENTHKVAEILWNRQIQVNFVSKYADCFISISGTGQVIWDPQVLQNHWHPIFKSWFPKGLSDSSLVLLKVEVDGAEYWSTQSEANSKVFNINRQKWKVQEGKEWTDHGKIDLIG